MEKSDIGLKLMSLYRDISKSRHSHNDGASNSVYDDPDTSSVEDMTTAILSSLDNRDFDEALSLLDEWEFDYPLENEGTSLYKYLRSEYYLRLLDGEECFTETVSNLNEAIDAAAAFFKANEEEGHAMDDVAIELSNRLKNIKESIDQDNLEEEGLQISELEEPVVLPVQEDETTRGLIIRALKRHNKKYKYLSSEAGYLLRCICNELGIEEPID